MRTFARTLATLVLVACAAPAPATSRASGAASPGRAPAAPSSSQAGSSRIDCSRACENEERCVEQDGRCFRRAEKDVVCNEPKRVVGVRMPSMCEAHGECHARNGACRATADAECAASQDCAERGLCRLDHGVCVATAASCTASQGCTQWGKCTNVAGTCSASDTDCRAHVKCAEFGWCSPDRDGGCEPATDEDCKQSRSCAREGTCVKALYPNGNAHCVRK